MNPFNISISFKDALLLSFFFHLKRKHKSPLATCVQDLAGNREGEESHFPKDAIFPKDALRCSSALQHSHHSPCQQLNQKAAQAWVTLTARAPSSPITQLTHWDWASQRQHAKTSTNQAATAVSMGWALQFLCIKYTWTIACFYQPFSMGKVNAISLRLVMINTTAHLPPS